MNGRLERIERAARRRGLGAPKTWRFFECEDGMYRPATEWRGGEPAGDPMTAAQFEQWRKDNPDVGVVIEQIVTDWPPTGGGAL